MKPSPLAVLAALLLAAFPARAGNADDVIAAIGKCAALTDNPTRLACYDKVAAQAKTVEAAPQTQPQAAAPTQTAAAPPAAKKDEESWFGIAGWFGSDKVSPAAQSTPQQFGSENLPPPPAAPGAPPPLEPLDHITAKVSDVAFNYLAHFTVFLDNGQIWQQLASDDGKAHFSRTKKDTVTISRGLIGSYNLTIGNQDHFYKVKRLK